jgi:hypothetical protein
MLDFSLALLLATEPPPAYMLAKPHGLGVAADWLAHRQARRAYYREAGGPQREGEGEE